jgi:hypothetical protein
VATANPEASTTPQAGLLHRTWEKVATALAVIGLVDLTGQLIKWAAVIHWVVAKYAIVTAWLFGWLPFHIPPEWHDAIVLSSILLSVTNIGVYRETRWRIRSFWKAAETSAALLHKFSPLRLLLFVLLILGPFAAGALIFLYLGDLARDLLPFLNDDSSTTPSMLLVAAIFLMLFLFILSEILGIIVALALLFLLVAFVVAWRWILVTAAIFSALIAVNEVYVRYWLEPLAAR